MKPLRPPTALALLAIVQLACTSVHRPLAEPITEDALNAAIETIHASGARIEMLEDGLMADVYRYEWRELEDPPELYRPTDGFLWEPPPRVRQRVRMLDGPVESVYLSYSWIDSVEARSWPLWAGVEIQMAATSGFDLEGPLVIRADDAEEAARLTDAIDCLRRARRLPRSSHSESPASATDGEPVSRGP